MATKVRFSPKLGLWAMIALVVAAGLGLAARGWDLGWVFQLSEWVEPMGVLWINALQMTVIPLIVTQLLAALVRPGAAGSVGRLGGSSVMLFLTMLLAGNVFTILVAPSIVSNYRVSPDVVAGLRVESIPESALAAAQQSPGGVAEWLIGLVPTNPVAAFATGNIIQILVFTILVGIAIGRLDDEARQPLARTIHALAESMMVLIGWVLWGTPLGVFALILSVTISSGIGAMSLLVWYVVGLCALLIAVTLLLYPLTALFGRTTIRRFAQAAMPAQLVAMGTRSSLASLPALIQGGQEKMDLPPSATGFVLPLCVSTFKLNQAISPIFKFILLAHFFSIPLGVGDYVTFVTVSMLLSFGVVGVPRGGGGFKTLPLYIAVGIPIEGVVIIEAVKTIPDFFMTTLNVTADMSVATILTRDTRTEMGGAGLTMPAAASSMVVETDG
jgi:Na+/H+-dicarboxylate symporter